MRSPQLAKAELIGLHAKVVGSRDANLEGVEGIVVDETRNTFTFERPDGQETRIPKPGQSFEFTLEDGSRVLLDGATVAFAPEDRTKKAR